MTKRVHIYRDERWPEYDIEEDVDFEPNAVLTEDEIAQVKEARKAFEAAQDLLEKALGRGLADD